jgi:hypothetical protein
MSKTFKDLIEENKKIIFGLAKIKDLVIIEKSKSLDESKYFYGVVDSIDVFIDI